MEFSQISVVVQGALSQETIEVLTSIRKHLPQAEIIISTWEGTDVNAIAGLYDQLVLSKDPGAIIFDDKDKKTNSINRILVSSQNGINAATRKYVLRLRSDLELKNSNVLKLIDNFGVRNPASALFKQRIFAYEVFSIKYDVKKETKQKMLFHISDWCYLGLKEDLQTLFDVPVVKEPDFSRYFDTHKKPTDDIHTTKFWKMSPEQYITSMNAKKVFKDFNFEHYLDVTDENIRISEDFIINNFRVFSQKEWGISSLKLRYKYVKMFVHSPNLYYSKNESLIDYKKYCDNSIEIKNVEFLQKLCNKKYYESLRKHFFEVIYSKPSKKLTEFISLIYYLFKFLFYLAKDALYTKK